jgi:hypothetical protein
VTKTPFPLFGAGWSRGFHKVSNSIVLDLADVILEPRVTFWNMEVPEELNDRYSPDCQVIRIQWDDGGIPKLSPLFWYKLADYLEKQNKTVIVACMGGHGRTGTALAILAGIYRLHGNADIGEWVRARHCKNAIETYGQVEYIEEVLGEKTVVVPSWAHEINIWKRYRKGTSYGTGTYIDGDCKWAKTCVANDCGNCNEYELVEKNHPLMTDHQKVFGYFDKQDVYHTGYPPDDADVLCTVGQDDDGNDVFEYIYDKDSDGFLPSY